MTQPLVSKERIAQALAMVQDPEIHRPITELNMVDAIDVHPGNRIAVRVLLTVAACPMRTTIDRDVRAAVLDVPGVAEVTVEFGVMSDEQRATLRTRLRGGAQDDVVPFAQPDSRTRVFCVASGKGGVGKSTVTVNLAAAMAARGLAVGVLDADIHGHSIPGMLGVTGAPTQIDRLIVPPTARGVRVISIGMFVDSDKPVVWRGPMLHRALRQFLAQVFWGDLDVLLVDLPPGTGDIAISLAQLLPTAELLIVTTPQPTAARIAERAGAVAADTGQRVAGVVENMSWYEDPTGGRHALFGAGGGRVVSDRLAALLGTACPLLGQIPLNSEVGAAGDRGAPIVLAEPDSAAAEVFREVAQRLVVRPRGLAGRPLAVAVR
ncbi:Mrp/NBP35 family ATP-binding protein [Nocardia xishanensis]|uniref:Mrp/NBP35 family ATP-binding protein n=1 Tax=Nocardia xishanensis TaxID=238964 RepID=UPI000833E6B2|nr:P-loop NTPase [Nocardia xishanensis]